MTTTGEVLLKDILHFPQDNELRLVYTDWLEDIGELRRAEFIRVQLELEAFPYIHGLRRGDYKVEFGVSVWWDRAFYLLGRQGELYRGYGTEWSSGVALALGCTLGHGNGAGRVLLEFNCPCGRDGCTRTEGMVVAWWNYCRGFVDEVITTRQRWLRHGKDVVLVQPVSKLVLMDATPDTDDNLNPWWVRCGFDPDLCQPHCVPSDWWECLQKEEHTQVVGSHCYCPPGESVDILGKAALRWARKEAQLET